MTTIQDTTILQKQLIDILKELQLIQSRYKSFTKEKNRQLIEKYEFDLEDILFQTAFNKKYDKQLIQGKNFII